MRFKTGRQKDHEVDVQKGIEQGIEQGIDIGLQRGIDLRNIEVIERMPANGVDWNSITLFANLNEADFAALKVKHGK